MPLDQAANCDVAAHDFVGAGPGMCVRFGDWGVVGCATAWPPMGARLFGIPFPVLGRVRLRVVANHAEWHAIALHAAIFPLLLAVPRVHGIPDLREGGAESAHWLAIWDVQIVLGWTHPAGKTELKTFVWKKTKRDFDARPKKIPIPSI